MRIVAFTTSNWDDAVSSCRHEIVHPIFGLKAWSDRVSYLFAPVDRVIACGTWSEPSLCQVPECRVLNAGIPVGEPYDVYCRQYWMAATMAMMADVLNRKDWDYLVYLDTDCLVGSVDFPDLFNQFSARREILISPAWGDVPAGPLLVFKRQACVRFFHYRLRGNIAAPGNDNLLGEDEMARIFDGEWWNPWPGVSVRQDYPTPNREPLGWIDAPFVRQPHPDLIEPYLRERWSKVVPLR